MRNRKDKPSIVTRFFTFILFLFMAILGVLHAEESDASSSAAANVNTVYIRNVRVANTVNANPGLILNNAAVKQGGRFIAKDVHETIRSLYALGLFSDILVEASDVINDSLDLTIRVTENPIIHKIEFSGNSKIDNKELQGKISLNPGSWLTPAAINGAKNTLLSHYREKGYLLADVTVNTYSSKEDGRTVLEFEIKEGKKVVIGKISFHGVNAFTEKKLKSLMQDTKEDRWWRSGDFDEYKFRKDLELIEAFYQSEGFLDARIDKHDVSYTDDNRKLNIDIYLTESLKYYFGKAFFSGNELFSDTVLTTSFGMKPGIVFNKQLYDMAKYNVESMYREEGYLYIQMVEEKKYRNDTIDVTFRIKEGLPAYVNRVVITGNTKTWDKVLRREVLLRPGEIYRQSQLFISQRNIIQTNYFDEATPDIQQNFDRNVDIVFNVKEKESGTGQVSAGAGYSERDGFVFTAGLSMPNFALSRPFVEGAGQSVDLKAEWGKYSRTIDLGVTEPWFMDTPTLLGFRGYYWWKDYSNSQYYSTTTNITERRKGVELRTGRRLRWPDIYFNTYGTYNLSYREYIYGSESNNSTDQVIEGIRIRNNGYESSISLRLSRNSTDLPDFPTRGSTVEYNPSVSGYLLGGNYKFVKHRFVTQTYLPLPAKFILLQGFMFSHLRGSVVGRYDHYLAGGVNYEGIIRGYPDRAFGDLIPTNPHAGYNLIVSTTEIRYPIIDRRLYAGIFADFGNTWASLNKVDLQELKTGVGAGVKLMVPMLGLLGLDVAWGLDDYPVPSSPTDNGNPTSYEKSSGKKPPYFEFHFRIGR